MRLQSVLAVAAVANTGVRRQAHRSDPRWTQAGRPLGEFFAPAEQLLFDVGDLLKELGRESGGRLS